MISQAIRFGIVGAISAGLYIAVTWFLAVYHGVNRNEAILLAFALATTFHYFANYYWSFPGGAHRQAIGRYIVLVAACLLWNELGVELLYSGGVPLMMAVAICAALWPLVSFISLRAWVFSPSIPFRRNP